MAEIRRPKRGETEEDLLDQQRQFLQEKQIQNGGKFDDKTEAHGHEEKEVEDKMKRLEIKDEDEPSQEILQDIKERDTQGTVAPPPRLAEKRHFPRVHRAMDTNSDYEPQDGDDPTAKKRSIFAQNMRRKNDERKLEISQEQGPFAQCSVLVDGSGLGSASIAAEIHKENMALVSSMTPEQLMGERAELIKSLDPGTIAFLQSRRQRSRPQPTASAQSQSALICEPATQTDKKEDLSQWPHMGQAEDRKLEWTRPIEAMDRKEPTRTIGLPARFDFEGLPTDRVADLPSTSGLYHHGEEPEAPGYTLDELLHISRSSLLPQRALALQTLSKVLCLCHGGFYDDLLDRPLVPLLLDAGLAHILRWALDDATQTGIAAAVEALAALLVCPADEVFLDVTFSWHLGERSPLLGPGPTLPKAGHQETDAEIVTSDVIEGLLRQMHLLPRLRYILEVIRPPATVVLRILDILIRITRHSAWGAEQVAQCPRLLSTVASEFLPNTSAEPKGGAVNDVYGVPLAPALKLFRTIAAASKDLCREMRGYVPLSRFVKYLFDAPQLSLECLRTWTIFLANGLPTESIAEYVPVLFRQLQFFNDLKVCCEERAPSRFHCDFGSAFFHFLSTAVSQDPRHHDWVLTPMVLFVKDWTNKLRNIERDVTNWEMSMVARAWVLAASSYHAAYPKISEDARSLFEMCLLPFLRSPSWDRMLSRLREHSSITCTEPSAKGRYPSSLPSLGSLLRNGKPSPCLRETSTVHFVTHLVHAIHILAKRDPDIILQLGPLLIEHPAVVGFSRDSIVALSRGATLLDHWFVRHETHLLHLIVELAALRAGGDLEVALYHQVCLSVPCRLQRGDEALALRFLELSFDESFLTDWKDNERAKLADIRRVYVASLLALTEDGKSERHGVFFPVDFVYSPIWSLYLDDVTDTEDLEMEATERVTGALEWIGFLLRRRPAALSCIPPCNHVCKLGAAFMVGNDAFLLPSVKEALRKVLEELSLAGILQRASFEAQSCIDGIASFHDFFLQLLEHFEAVSYGDLLFGSLLLILVRQGHNGDLRRLLWTEHVPCLRLFAVPPSQLLVPLRNFLEPLEGDDRLLAAYFQCLVSGDVRPASCPVPYLTAVHHLHHFLFSKGPRLENPHLRSSMLMALLRGNEEWHGHLLRYDGPDQSTPLGFKVAAEIAKEVQAVIGKMRL